MIPRHVVDICPAVVQAIGPSLVGHFLFDPAVEAALNGKAEAIAAHATVAGLVLVATSLLLILAAVATMHAVGAVAAILKARSKRR